MSKVVLHYWRHFQQRISIHTSLDSAVRYGLRLAEDNEGYPYKIMVEDGGGPVEAVWDMTDKFGKDGYKDIFEFAEECGVDDEDVD